MENRDLKRSLGLFSRMYYTETKLEDTKLKSSSRYRHKLKSSELLRADLKSLKHNIF